MSTERPERPGRARLRQLEQLACDAACMLGERLGRERYLQSPVLSGELYLPCSREHLRAARVESELSGMAEAAWRSYWSSQDLAHHTQMAALGFVKGGV